MSIDQENVFNDQQSDNGVFAADDNDRPVSSKKEPSKAKNSKLFKSLGFASGILITVLLL